MIDLHCHILPGIDDGAADLAVAIAMAEAFVADGVSVVACTPHITPGVYQNSGPQIRAAVVAFQQQLDDRGIPLRLVPGADVHVVHDLAAGLASGRLLSIADSRYVLVEPPHHVAPPRLENLFFDLQVSGYVPILTHPERLTWIETRYAAIESLANAGVWMQVTAGSLTGAFGRRPKYWAERMLAEGVVHVIATDAHDMRRRPPVLAAGFERAAAIVGGEAAEKMVLTRPRDVIDNVVSLSEEHHLGVASALVEPGKRHVMSGTKGSVRRHDQELGERDVVDDRAAGGGIVGRLRRFFE